MNINFKIAGVDVQALEVGVNAKLGEISYSIEGLNMMEYLQVMKAVPGIVRQIKQIIEEPASESSEDDFVDNGDDEVIIPSPDLHYFDHHHPEDEENADDAEDEDADEDDEQERINNFTDDDDEEPVAKPHRRKFRPKKPELSVNR